MHGVMSIYFVQVLFPHITLKQQASLLDGFFEMLLCLYVKQGCPKLYPELALAFIPKEFKNKENPWFEVVEYAVGLHDLAEQIVNESHVIQLVRSLVKAQKEFGSEDKKDLYLKVAQLTVEGYKEFGWCRDGVGREKVWDV